MKFVIIEHDCDSPLVITKDRADVEAYLKAQIAKEAYDFFRAHNWAPGNAMTLPHGWLFSVHDHVVF